MTESPRDEREKDKIVQDIYDALEAENWGGNTDLLVIELTFKQKFDCNIFMRKKLKKRAR